MTTAFIVLLGTVVIRASCHNFELEEFDGRDCMTLRRTWRAVLASRTCSKNERASFWHMHRNRQIIQCLTNRFFGLIRFYGERSGGRRLIQFLHFPSAYLQTQLYFPQGIFNC